MLPKQEAMTRIAGLSIAGLLLLAGPALAAGSSDVAALQVALRARGLYAGTVDGVQGPSTANALIAFQRKTGLEPDGVAGSLTRAALGRFGGPDLGSRTLALGAVGWDVAELQFLLAWHGFPSDRFDGVFGTHVEVAVRRYQRFAGLPAVGVAGPETIASLSAPPPRSPMTLAWPLNAPIGDPFGPRGTRFHAGIDLRAAAGVPVAAAAPGRVVFAGPRGTFGNTVIVAHGDGVRTLYAHLSRIDVTVGQRVGAAAEVGLVGATGDASGPHLHFEVRVRGAAVDPLSALP